MAKKSQGMFGGRTHRSMEKAKTNYGYLVLPEDVNVFKPEGGAEVVFDVVPYIVSDSAHIDNKKYEDDAVVGNPWWKRPLRVHRDVGVEGVSIVCPTTFGNKCPICEYGAKLRKEGTEWDVLKDIFPKSRTLFLIVPIDTSDYEVDYTEGEVHILDISDHLFLEILTEEVGKDIDYENFPDPYDGMSLRVYFRSKKLGKNKYAEASKVDFEDRETQYDEEFVNALPCLDDMLKILPYKEIEAMYFGMEDMDDEDMDEGELEEEAPPRRKKSTKPTRKVKAKPEPEEEEEEEEEEEAPKRKAVTRKSPTKKVKKEEPEEEEEEEEAPKRKATIRKPKKAAAKLECPVGLKFGVDTDQYNECDTCPIWDACSEEKEKNK